MSTANNIIIKKATLAKVNKKMIEVFKDYRKTMLEVNQDPDNFDIKKLYNDLFDQTIPLSDDKAIKIEHLINAFVNVSLKNNGELVRKFIRDGLEDIMDHGGLVVYEQNDENEEDSVD